MKQETIMCQLFNFSIATYYKRKRENNLAIKLVEQYCSKKDLIEYSKTGKISKYDNSKALEKIALQKYHNYINPILDESYTILNSLFFKGLPKDRDNLSNILSYVPIFIFFHYIDNPYRNNDILNTNFEENETTQALYNGDYPINNFGAIIILLLNKYKSYQVQGSYINDIFKIDEELLSLFDIFHKDRGFQLYYNADILYDGDEEKKNFHAYCNFLYESIRVKQSLYEPIEQKNEKLASLFKKIKYNPQINYRTDIKFAKFELPEKIKLQNEEYDEF